MFVGTRFGANKTFSLPGSDISEFQQQTSWEINPTTKIKYQQFDRCSKRWPPKQLQTVIVRRPGLFSSGSSSLVWSFFNVSIQWKRKHRIRATHLSTEIGLWTLKLHFFRIIPIRLCFMYFWFSDLAAKVKFTVEHISWLLSVPQPLFQWHHSNFRVWLGQLAICSRLIYLRQLETNTCTMCTYIPGINQGQRVAEKYTYEL